VSDRSATQKNSKSRRWLDELHRFVTISHLLYQRSMWLLPFRLWVTYHDTYAKRRVLKRLVRILRHKMQGVKAQKRTTEHHHNHFRLLTFPHWHLKDWVLYKTLKTNLFHENSYTFYLQKNTYSYIWWRDRVRWKQERWRMLGAEGLARREIWILRQPNNCFSREESSLNYLDIDMKTPVQGSLIKFRTYFAR